MWKGEYRGQDVAVRVIRTYSNDEVRRVVRVGCSISVHHVQTTIFFYRGSAQRL